MVNEKMHVDHHCISGCMAFITWKYGNIVARVFVVDGWRFDGHRYFWDEFTRAREPRPVITRVGKSSASVITWPIPRRTRAQFVGRHEQQEKRTGPDYLGCRMHDANNGEGR